ncbi:MAG TPA: putative sugar nucleotidyl transferase, partial [Candidatus Eisenbacteria bacterium]
GEKAMIRALVVFEDGQWPLLRPLTELLPVPALAFGASSLAERWRRATSLPLLAIEARPRPLAAWRRPAPEGTPAPETGAEALVVNAAALPGTWLEAMRSGSGPALLTCCGRIAAARVGIEQLRPGLGRGERFEAFLAGLDLPRADAAMSFLVYPWHLIEENPGALARDLAAGPFEKRGEIHRLASLEAPDAIAVEEGARIDAFAVLDARGGPIRIGRNARVRAHTVVTGPCVVGAGSELLGGVVGVSTIGERCFIAGEVESCLWQGFGNKRHHGFVGHSAIGEWVNLGALTTTSDLKNNYGRVRVWVNGREIDTGLTKVGAFIGAHVKTGIGSLLPTGAAIGTGANLFGGGRFAPRLVPPFAWWNGEQLAEHRLEAFLGTARTAMARRGRPLEPADEGLLTEWFEASAAERGPALRPVQDRGAAAAS